MPTISIIVPALNEEKYLPILLKSIQAQSFQDYEVIVADAGSTDRTVEIATEFGAKVVKGGMPGPGRNRGAEVAKGELFFFFDSDVLLPKDFLEKAYQEMQEKMIDLATCEFEPISDLRVDKISFKISNLIVKMNLLLNPHAAGFCIFISSRLFRRIGGFDESLKLAEDHDLVKRAAKHRPLHFLKNVELGVSVRRLEKEGRFNLLKKYMQVEMHLLTKGNVKENIIEYEFGNFSEDEANKGKKLLDEIEAKVIELDRKYNDFYEKATANWNEFQAFQDKWKNNLDEFGSIVKSFFVKK